MKINRLITLLVLLSSFHFSNSQSYKEQLTFSGAGDLTMSLGRYRIGTTINVLFYVDGGWAQDGGVYHIGADWAGQFKVVYRGESQISDRLRFYSYVDPNTNSYGYLFATWDNQSPSESYSNTVRFTISSNGDFNINNTGSFSNATEAKDLLVIQTGSENVGIGTSSPFSGTGNKGLHISRGHHSSLLLGDPQNGYGGIIQTSDSKQRVFIGANLYDDESGSWSGMQAGKGSAGISIIADEGSWGTAIDFVTSPTDGHYYRSMRIMGNGNVGIGLNSTAPSEKLEVNGTIRSKEVKVEVSPWPDYVFSSDYELMPLEEIEQFIQSNHHLPEIPSAQEIEANGLQLGEMNRLLLQKIEELTLHVIELKKEIDILKSTSK